MFNKNINDMFTCRIVRKITLVIGYRYYIRDILPTRNYLSNIYYIKIIK